MKVRYHHDMRRLQLPHDRYRAPPSAWPSCRSCPATTPAGARSRPATTRSCSGVITPCVRPGVTHVYHQYTIRVNERDAFAEQLKRAGRRERHLLPDPGPPAEAVPRARLRRRALPGHGAAHRAGAQHPGPSVADRRRGRDGHRGRERDGRRARPARRRGAVPMSDPAPRPLRAGVVGLGMMGRNHVRVWDESVHGVELVAVADPDPAAVRRATQRRRARGYEDAGAHARRGGARPRQHRGARPACTCR